MKILVCVKQVADSESPFSIAGDESRLEFGERVTWRINSYDEYAVEEALLIAEKQQDTLIDVLSIGPDRVKDSIRRAMSMGVRDGYHISVETQGNIEPETKARIIADFAQKRQYSLILMGVMSEDFGNCAVAPMTAELLGMPCATHVIKQETDPESESVYAEREIDGTMRHTVTLRLPAIISVQSGINHPRYPSLSNVLRAKGATIATLFPDDDDSPPRKAVSRKLFLPGETRRGAVLQGNSADMAEELCQFLHSKSLL